MHKASSHTSRREAPQQRLQTANRADPNASPETMNAHTTSDSDQSSTESFLAHFFPLACGFFTAGIVYQQVNEPFWLLVSVTFFLLAVAYLIATIIHDLFALRHSSQRAKSHRRFSQRIIEVMGRITSNRFLFLLGIVVLPCVEIILIRMGDAMIDSPQILRWIQSALGAVYLLYFGCIVFMQYHRAMLLMLKGKEAELTEAKERMDRIARNNEIAAHIHDTMSSTLSFIAFTAQNHMDSIDGQEEKTTGTTVSESERKDWKNINDAALALLDNTHTVIQILREEPSDIASHTRHISIVAHEPTPATTTLGDLHRNIMQLCHENDERLHSLGFTGNAAFHSDNCDSHHFAIDNTQKDEITEDSATTSCLPTSMATKLQHFIQEVYTDICRYANRDAPYSLLCTFGNDSITITETNSISRIPQIATDRPLGMSTGLDFHSQWIRQLGGEFNTSAEDGEWVLFAVIPFENNRQ